jgi:hypothetical protein
MKNPIILLSFLTIGAVILWLHGCRKEVCTQVIHIEVPVLNLERLKSVELHIQNNEGKVRMADIIYPHDFTNNVAINDYQLNDLPQNEQLLAVYRFYSYDGSWVEKEIPIQ